MKRTPYPGSTQEHAATLRTTLKAHGITSQDVSVRSDCYSMGSSLRVTVKRAGLPLSIAAIRALAEGHERIHRCDYSGEILNGGNRFVDVHLSDEAREQYAAPWLEPVKAAMVELDDVSPNCLIPVAGTGERFKVGRGMNGWGYSLWDTNSHSCEYIDAREMAIAVGTQAVAP
jgi:hypothetical protein